MNGWMHGCMDGWMTDEQMDGWMEFDKDLYGFIWVDGWIDGWMTN